MSQIDTARIGGVAYDETCAVTAVAVPPGSCEVPVPVSKTPAQDVETFNPWTVVNLVFHRLVDEGLHPVLGETGDPGAPAAALLRALGIEPAAEGNRQVARDVKAHLAEIRAAVLDP